MRVPGNPDTLVRRDAFSLLAALSMQPLLLPAQPTLAAATYNPGERPEELKEMLGGLKPGSGRPLNALIKFRAETGVDRVAEMGNPLFKPGQILDTLRTSGGGTAEVAFTFPETW